MTRASTPGKPAAAFDTYEGNGLGRCNGQSGAMAKWKFTDAGEPGKDDFMEIEITDAMGNVVLSASGFLKREPPGPLRVRQQS
jgi:hypothetical protein